MNVKHELTAALLLVLLGAAQFTVSAQITVGVKRGDWVEYAVSFTGTPMSGHDATWARMEIKGVEGEKVNVTFTSLLSNGTEENVTENLDFGTGRLIDYFVIPAGLEKGDTFFDRNEGNVSISNVEVRTYAGASRTVVTGTTLYTLWYWDQATGVLVEARSEYPGYTLTTIANKTSLWAPQIFGLDQPVFFALVTVAVAVVVIIAVFVVLRKKQNHVSTEAETVHEKPAV